MDVPVTTCKLLLKLRCQGTNSSLLAILLLDLEPALVEPASAQSDALGSSVSLDDLDMLGNCYFFCWD